jgi:hypothetical protein
MLFSHPSPRSATHEASVRIRTLIVTTAVLAGCGGTKEPEIIRVCPEFPNPPASQAGFTFALTEEVRPGHAPVPTNDSEAIVFGLAYPPLVQTDCEGEVQPAAAASWTPSPETQSWSFRMSPDAAFGDGSPITAGDVKDMWLERRNPAALVAPWIWDHVQSEGLEVPDDDELVIHAPNAYADLLHALTQPSLALARGRDSEWPLGTRGLVEAPEHFDQRKAAEVVWNRGPNSRGGASEIRFLLMEEATPQQLVEAGVDAFFVRDKTAVEYARQLEGYDVTAFPYSRLYVLLTPEPDVVNKIEKKDLEMLLPLSIGDARLVKNADGYRHDAPKSKDKLKQRLDRIVVPWWDRDARAIASELSKIWRERSKRGYPAILPKRRGEFYRHVLEGKDALYVFPVYPILASEGLQKLHLLRSAPWLEERGGSVALFETRGHLVTKKELTGFDSGYDGFPRLESAGWTSGRLP